MFLTGRGGVLKRTSQHMRIRDRSLILVVSQGLTQSVTIVLGVILVRLIAVETFGTYRQALLVLMFLSGVMSLQLQSSFYYFLPRQSLEDRRALLLQTILISLSTALVMFVVMFFCAGQISGLLSNPELAPFIRILAFYAFVDRLLVLTPHFMISLDRPIRGAAYSLLAAVSRIASVVIIFAAGYGISTVLWGMVAVGSTLAVAGCVDMARLCPAGAWRLNVGLVAEQWRYSWPLWATAISGILNYQFDKLLISGYFDPATYAVYSVGAIELPVVMLITTSVSTAVMPNLVSLAKEGKRVETLHVWQEAARKCSLVIFPCFVFFLVVSNDFIRLLYSDAYAKAAWPFAIYLFVLPVRVTIYSAMLRALGRTRVIAVAAVSGLVVNICLSTLLVFIGKGSLLSFVGPSIGTVVTVCWMGGYQLLRIRSEIDVPLASVMRWKQLGGTLLIAVVCGLVVLMIPTAGMSLVGRLVMRTAAFLALLALLVWRTRMLHDDEIQLLALPFRMLRRHRTPAERP